MDGLTLLSDAAAAGLTVRADGDRLVIRGPRKAEPLARRLLEHKRQVIAALGPLSAANRRGPGPFRNAEGPGGRRSARDSLPWPAALADWVLLLEPADLPATFWLRAGVEVVNRERFLTSLRADVLAGPTGPRAFYGGVQSDLRHVRGLLLGMEG